MNGGLGADRHRGGRGPDDMQGSFGHDRLSGARGHDFLMPNVGNDRVVGGKGFDFVNYAGLTTRDGGSRGNGNPMHIDLRRGFADGLGHDELASIEAAWGGGDGDRIYGNGKRNLFIAQAGQDVVRGRGGNDSVHAGAGDDRVFGGRGKDEIFGMTGNDDLNAGRGDDWLVFDIKIGRKSRPMSGHHAVVVDLRRGSSRGARRGTQGNDTISGFENVRGTDEDDVLRGNDRRNRLIAFGGDDVLRGRGGKDYLDGGRRSDDGNGGGGTDRCVRIERRMGCER